MPETKPELCRLRAPGGMAALLAHSYTLGVLVLYPWYLKALLGITPFKLTGYLSFTLLSLFLLSFAMPEHRPTKPSAPTFWVLCYAAAAVLSTALSLSPKLSLWASQGYIGGVFLALACAFGYLAAAVYLPQSAVRTLWLPFCAAGALNALYTVANAFGVDPFGFTSALNAWDRYIFFGTIGNVDYYNSYLCLWLPVAVWYWLVGSGKKRVAAGFFAICGLVSLAALDPGIATLGLVGAVVVLLWCVPLHRAMTARLLQLAAGWLLAQCLVAALAARFTLWMQERPFAVFGTPAVALPLAALLLAASALLCRPAPEHRHNMALQRCFAAAPLALLAAGFAAVNLGGLSFGAFDNFLRLDAAWATGRGALFADAASVFAGGSVLRKLVGVGPGMFWRCVQMMPVPYPLPDAIGTHCEYLQELVCGGVLGLAVWLGVLFSHLHPAACAVRQGRTAQAPWLLAAVAYAVQAGFNNRVATVFPLFMVLLAVLRVAGKGDEAAAAPRGATAAALAGAVVLGAAATVAGGLLLAPLLA